MSGDWPPEWGDPDGDDAGTEAGQPDAAADARLSEVTAYLAALPDPVLPDAVEARISAAIAAAAADRGEAATISGRTLRRDSRRPKVRRRGKFGLRAISSVAACLVIAGFGYLLTQAGGSSSSSSAATAESPQVAAGSAAGAAASPALGLNGPVVPGAAQGVPTTTAAPTAAASAQFSVTSRGDVYQKSTLVSQVRERLRLLASQQGSRALTPVLVGCVFHVTHNTVPSLVDEATYAGRPVYVIAVSSRAWVVGRGCSATDPELITTVSLAGLRGNLSALGSVEDRQT